LPTESGLREEQNVCMRVVGVMMDADEIREVIMGVEASIEGAQGSCRAIEEKSVNGVSVLIDLVKNLLGKREHQMNGFPFLALGLQTPEVEDPFNNLRGIRKIPERIDGPADCVVNETEAPEFEWAGFAFSVSKAEKRSVGKCGRSKPNLSVDRFCVLVQVAANEAAEML